jgi:tetratricopeptide (TPR) repeat protein
MMAAAGALLLSLGSPAQQQSQSDQGSGNGQPKTKTRQGTSKPAAPAPAPPASSAAQENPFPADQPQRAAQPKQQGSDPAPDAPDAGQVPAPAAGKPGDAAPGNAAKDNPFPEDLSKAAAAAANSNSSGPADSSSSSSSSSSNSNPNGAGGDPNADVPSDTGRRRLRKPSAKDIESGSLAGEGRAQDDVRVGQYYLHDGNYKGAYGRFQEATRLDPANIDAIYGLAAAADKLHHKDEALENYKVYLEVAPKGSQAKAARKALEDLSR